MRQSVPPVLHHIVEHEQQSELRNNRQGHERTPGIGNHERGDERAAHQNERLRQEYECPDAQHFDDCVASGLPRLTEESRECDL